MVPDLGIGTGQRIFSVLGAFLEKLVQSYFVAMKLRDI